MEDLNINISHKRTDSDKGQFDMTLNGTRAGEMFYKIYPEGYIDIKHTEVDPIHRGKGLAQHLVSAAVMMSRQEKWKIKSGCPYAAKVLSRNDEYQDIYIS